MDHFLCCSPFSTIRICRKWERGHPHVLLNISGWMRENGTLHWMCKNVKLFSQWWAPTSVQRKQYIVTVYGCTSNSICITNPNACPVYADISSSNLGGCLFADSIHGHSTSAYIILWFKLFGYKWDYSKTYVPGPKIVMNRRLADVLYWSIYNSGIVVIKSLT